MINILFNYIGLYAPIILFFFTLFLLRNLKIYSLFFISGFFLNNILNILLKLIIKEPRPSKDIKILEIAVNNGIRVGFDKFGMPSGHAQNCGFCLCFIFFTLYNPFITFFYLFISIISLFQRYLFHNHTILQLFIGFIIGILFAYFTYFFANKTIVGNIQAKKDDDAPI